MFLDFESTLVLLAPEPILFVATLDDCMELLSELIILLATGVFDRCLPSCDAVPALGVLEFPLGVTIFEAAVVLPAAVLVPAAVLLLATEGFSFLSKSWNLRSISNIAYLRTTISASFSFCLDYSYSIICR